MSSSDFDFTIACLKGTQEEEEKTQDECLKQ